MKRVRLIIENSVFTGIPYCVPAHKFVEIHKFTSYWGDFSPLYYAIDSIFEKKHQNENQYDDT